MLSIKISVYIYIYFRFLFNIFFECLISFPNCYGRNDVCYRKIFKALDDDDEEVGFHILLTKSGFQYCFLHIHLTMQFMSNSPFFFCLLMYMFSSD